MSVISESSREQHSFESRFQQIGTITELPSQLRAAAEDLKNLILNRTEQFRLQGLSPRQRVLILKGNSISFFVDLLSIWKLGACAVPLDPKTPTRETENLGRHCQAHFQISSQADDLAPLHFGSDELDPDTASSIGQLILYTSGSTGRPKAVVHSLQTLENRLRALEKHIPAEEFQKTLCLLPTHFGHGLIANCLLPLLTGKHLYLRQLNTPLIGQGLKTIVDQEQIQFFSSVPSLWQMIDETAGPTGQSLQRIHCASAPFMSRTQQIIKRWAPRHARLFNVYGTTELGSWVSGHEIKNDTMAGHVGHGWGCQFKISNPDPDQVGEVLIRSEGLALTYWGQDEVFKQKVESGWFATGDLGRLSETEGLMLKGRNDDLINRAGLKVYPDEVEAVLLNHPEIHAVCVFSVPHPISGQAVAAAFVPKASSQVSSADLEIFCTQLLPQYRIPSTWFAVRSLPTNERGKVSRHKVREFCLQSIATTSGDQ